MTPKDDSLRWLWGLWVCVLLAGCQAQAARHAPMWPMIHSAVRVDLNNAREVTAALYAQLDEWKAVAYHYGGLSKEGVDCSGFVYVTFLSNFGITLPRTTTQQVVVGAGVSESALRPGDLVFFKTGRVSRHVGILVEGRTFLHVSKRRGVMLSRLDDEYWAQRYWTSRRVSEAPATERPLAMPEAL